MDPFPAFARTVSASPRQARPEKVLRARNAQELHQLHRGHRIAARRMGLASAHVQSPRALPPRANARQPRSDLYESKRPGRKNHRSRTRLDTAMPTLDTK